MERGTAAKRLEISFESVDAFRHTSHNARTLRGALLSLLVCDRS